MQKFSSESFVYPPNRITVCYQELERLKYTKLGFYLLLCLGVKLSLSHQREGNRLVVCEKRVLRRVFGPKSEEMQEAEKNCLLRFS